MRKSLKYIIAGCVLALSGCIRNDIPYPYVELAITSVEGEGFTCTAADINMSNRTAVIHLDEATDMGQVSITALGMTEGAVSDVTFPGVFNMHSDLQVTLELYQKFDWTIKAQQEISRYFNVRGQIGVSRIDTEKLEAWVSVPEGTDMSNIQITSLKLGPEGVTTMSPDPSEITTFETYRTVTVTYHDRRETWLLYVETTPVLANINSAVPGSRVMWLEASVAENESMGYRYRRAGDEEWTEVSSDDITVSDGMLTAYVGGLRPETEYQVVAYSGDFVSEVVDLTTGEEAALPNSDFEQWATLDFVCPFLSYETAFWGTGNKGANAVGDVLTTPAVDPRPGSEGKYSAQLESKFPGLGAIGKFAAGNIFTGEYLETILTSMSGIVAFGRPFTARPTALHGWMKYTRGTITYTNEDPKFQPAGENVAVGAPDSGIIYVALGNWTAEEYGHNYQNPNWDSEQMPIIVDTRDPSTFFNKNSDAVIAYGELILDETVSGWTEFNIPIEYRRFDVQPTHIVLICTSSRFGDYFIGSTGSKMWVDDLVLKYDK